VFGVGWRKNRLATEHFGDDEDQKGPAQATAKEQIDQGIADGGKHGMNQRDHNGFNILFSVWFRNRRAGVSPLCPALVLRQLKIFSSFQAALEQIALHVPSLILKHLRRMCKKRGHWVRAICKQKSLKRAIHPEFLAIDTMGCTSSHRKFASLKSGLKN
jgi:hypothetical protein